MKRCDGNSQAWQRKVAPRAGAWIETYLLVRCKICGGSPPVRGRGLTPLVALILCNPIGRPPCGGVD